MALKSDSQGFLVGEKIEIGTAMSTLRSIGADVRAIRQILTRGAGKHDAERNSSRRSSAPADAARSPKAVAARERYESMRQPARDAHGRFVGASAPQTTKSPQLPQTPQTPQSAMAPQAVGGKQEKSMRALAPAVVPGGAIVLRPARVPVGDAEQKMPARPGKQAVVTPNQPRGQRDEKGRFAGGESGGNGESDDGRGGIVGALNRMSGSILRSGESIGDADPAVAAFNEVAQPLARGWELISGGDSDKKQIGLLRRIYGALNGGNKENTAFQKAAKRSLGVIEGNSEKKDGEGGGVITKLMGGLKNLIPGLGIAGGGLIGGMMKGGAGLLKRIPLLGSLFSIGGAASDIFDSENDDGLSRLEKDKRAGKAAGGAAGSIGGMLAGAKIGASLGALGGPVGAAISGVIGGAAGMFFGDQAGQIIGDKMGGWFNELREADIPGKIVAAWDSVVAGFKSVYEGIGGAWNGFVDSARAGVDAVTNMLKTAYEALKKIPVVGPAIQKAENAAKKTAEVVGDGVRAAKEKAVEVGADVKARAIEAGAAAKENVVSATKASAEYVANNTTVGKGAKAASGVAERAYNVTAATAGSVLETVMPKGYRHKALFDGIKGGDSLAKNGSYTDEEAAKIRELKTSGANTSANVKGGMSTEIQDKISAQAKKAGLDPVMMLKVAAMESGGNANAVSSTGASGVYQLTGQTASGLGVKNRFDADQNIEGGMKLTKQNQSTLEKSGLPVSPENLYMMLQLGPKAAQEVIRGAGDGKSKADMSPDTQKAMNLNYGAGSKTAADYIATNKKALDDRYALVTKGTDAPQTAIASAKQSSPAITQVAQNNPVAPSIPASPPQPIVTSAPSPNIPKMAAAPAIADAPAVISPVGSGGGNGKQTTILKAKDATQDMADRRLALIATGGLSA